MTKLLFVSGFPFAHSELVDESKSAANTLKIVRVLIEE